MAHGDGGVVSLVKFNPMKIETERLELIPLTPHQLKLWIKDLSVLERKLDCIYKGEPLQGFFLGIVRGQLAVTEADKERYLWHTFWLLIRKADRLVIGAADFKDIPE